MDKQKRKYTKKDTRKYWYFIIEEECVLCGRSERWVERRYTHRPKKWKDRHRYEQNACGHHFC